MADQEFGGLAYTVPTRVLTTANPHATSITDYALHMDEANHFYNWLGLHGYRDGLTNRMGELAGDLVPTQPAAPTLQQVLLELTTEVRKLREAVELNNRSRIRPDGRRAAPKIVEEGENA